MSADPSPPPSPDDAIQNWLTKAETLVALIVENFRRGTWVKRLLLLDALVVFALNAEVFTRVLKIFAILSKDEALPDWYGAAFWATVGVLFLTALLVALFTPTATKVEAIDLAERKAIKGLRPFTAEDAEIFARLQRNRSLRECLESITSENFRFGILMGESGCGKTSFLQAGVVPKLTEPEADYRAVYVRFSDRLPINAIRDDLVKQLKISKERLESEDLVALLQTAVDAINQPLILFFDQFEQFFVHAPRKPDRQPFIRALTDWYHSDLPVRVLVCMRGDMLDRLVELHQALGYALSPQEVFRLEKFSPEEATRVLQVIAETEKLRFEESFVRELAERELADREDGAISPVDLQILGWMIERQNADELRAFNQQAFQKFGGVEGLMIRFLENTLEARVIKSQREAAVKVLLALTDLDRNVRAGALSLTEIQEKLKDTVKADEVAEAIRWLVRGDVRLITPEEKAEETVYELAHERLIPAVRKVAGKELTEAQRANELLNRRVNEWLGNQFSSRYLFSPIELWQLKRQQPYLEWGTNRRQKERLWQKSWQRLYRTVGALALVLLVLLSGWGWLLTPMGQRWQMWRELATVSQKVNDEGRSIAVATFAKDTNLQQVLSISASIQDEYYRVDALTKAVKVYEQLGESNVALKILQEALIAARQTQDRYYKADALTKVAEMYEQLGESNAALKILQEALIAARQTQDSYKADALTKVAEMYEQLGESNAALKILQEALIAARRIQFQYYRIYTLGTVAETYEKIDKSDLAHEVLQEALTAVPQLQDTHSTTYVIKRIVVTASTLDDVDTAEAFLQDSLVITRKIREKYYKVEALSAVAEAYEKIDKSDLAHEVLQEALITAQQIQYEDTQAYVFGIIASAASTLNNIDITKAILQDILASTQQIQNNYNKAEAIWYIANAASTSNDINTAKTILQDTLVAAERIQDKYYRAYTYGRIAEAATTLNDPDIAKTIIQKALTATQQTQRGNFKADELGTIAKIYAELGDWRSAHRAVNNCVSNECQVESLAAALTVWAEGQHPELAEEEEE